jgi:hypothetical protein
LAGGGGGQRIIIDLCVVGAQSIIMLELQGNVPLKDINDNIYLGTSKDEGGHN